MSLLLRNTSDMSFRIPPPFQAGEESAVQSIGTSLRDVHAKLNRSIYSGALRLTLLHAKPKVLSEKF
jgi:hypothetical protein